MCTYSSQIRWGILNIFYRFCFDYVSLVANGFDLALIHIYEKLNGLDARIVHTRHDEIIVEAGKAIADQVQAILNESMEEAFRKIIPKVPFVVEIRVAEAWGGDPPYGQYYQLIGRVFPASGTQFQSRSLPPPAHEERFISKVRFCYPNRMGDVFRARLYYIPGPRFYPGRLNYYCSFNGVLKKDGQVESLSGKETVKLPKTPDSPVLSSFVVDDNAVAERMRAHEFRNNGICGRYDLR